MVEAVWTGDVRGRLRFERGARALHPSLRGRRVGPYGAGWFRYDVDVDVAHYDTTRHVTVRFSEGRQQPLVHADGPSTSPHRYDDGGLCMWHPTDSVAHRWTLADGLVDLLDVVAAHLFREAWWRETGEWLGPQAPHHAAQEAA